MSSGRFFYSTRGDTYFCDSRSVRLIEKDSSESNIRLLSPDLGSHTLYFGLGEVP